MNAQDKTDKTCSAEEQIITLPKISRDGHATTEEPEESCLPD